MTAPSTELIAGVTVLTALDQAYRAALARTAIEVAQALRAVWPTIDPQNIAGTSDQWLQTAVERVLAGQRNAQATATAYTRQVRRLTVPDAPAWTPPPPAPPNREQVTKSLIYTGLATTARELGKLEALAKQPYAEPDDREEGEPATVESDQRTIEGRRQRLIEQGIIRATAAATRHVTTAGMDQLKANVQNDKVALGWYRTTKAGCCYFCAMLASRGLVYKSDSFKASNERFAGPGEQKVHDSCVPAGTLVAGPSVEVGYRRRYEGEAIYFRTASGNELTITPNHPVLTDQGWVPAGLLDHGSNVVSRPSGEWALLGVPDEQQRPTPIEDRLGALLVEGGALSMPPSAEQFHGDWFDSEVDVVASDRLLADWVEAEIAEVSIKLLFSDGGASGPAASLAGLCSEHHLFLAGNAPSGGEVRGGDLSRPLLGGQAGLPGERGVPSVARFDTQFNEASSYDTSVDSELFRELFDRVSGEVSLSEAPGVDPNPLAAPSRFDPPSPEFGKHDAVAYADLGSRLLGRLAGQVELDRVVEFRRISLPSSHVYNLQTAEGWYSANGVIVSNCGCGLRPVYTTGDGLPERTQEFSDLWADSTEGFSGNDAVNAFRRKYEGRVAPREGR